MKVGKMKKMNQFRRLKWNLLQENTLCTNSSQKNLTGNFSSVCDHYKHNEQKLEINTV